MNEDNTKAVNKELCYRPMEETILDTLEWSIFNKKQKWVAGLEREKEVCLIKIVENIILAKLFTPSVYPTFQLKYILGF